MITAWQELAPAKINLALHITGKRADGYHLLDSWVQFTTLTDVLTAEVLENTTVVTLKADSDFAANMQLNEDNLIIKAAKAFQKQFGITQGARLHVQKHIPVGAGLGGGSADAAATLRLLNRAWNVNAFTEALVPIAAALGADVPACLYNQPARMRGTGEQLTPCPSMSNWGVLLVFPGKPLATAEVYHAMQPPYSGEILADPARLGWQGALHYSVNDLERPAFALYPELQSLLKSMQQLPGCSMARMSGSGSACFALFENEQQAKIVQQKWQEKHPEMWTHAGSFFAQ